MGFFLIPTSSALFLMKDGSGTVAAGAISVAALVGIGLLSASSGFRSSRNVRNGDDPHTTSGPADATSNDSLAPPVRFLNASRRIMSSS